MGCFWPLQIVSGRPHACGFYLMDPTGRRGPVQLKLPSLVHIMRDSFVCNGLICICTPIHNFIVRNAGIDEFSVLPLRPSARSSVQLISKWAIGFGLVHNTNDFMVVGVTAEHNIFALTDKWCFTVDIYVQGSSRWRSSFKPDQTLDDKLYLRLGKGEYANGAYHWLVSFNPPRVMLCTPVCLLSFDIADEVLYWTSFPEVPGERHSWKLLKQKDSIAYICRQLSCKEEGYSLWSRTGDCSNGSWIKKYAFKLSYGVRSHPVLFWKSSLLLMDSTGKILSLVDLHTGNIVKVFHLDNPCLAIQFSTRVFFQLNHRCH
ncbi:hypothetical protein Drorol1_Dr00001496 [Drosera rotundifolia]